MQSFNYIIDFIFFLDIIISFRTVYIDDLGNEEIRGYYIALQYIKSTFIIDFLATVPWTNVLQVFKAYRDYEANLKTTGGNPWLELLGVLKLGRILRLNKIIQFLKATDNVKASLRIFKMVLFLVVYLHCFTCYWWQVIKGTQKWIRPVDQVTDDIYQLYEKAFSQQYLYSLQVIVLNCLGNDIQPRNFYETAICSIGLFLGALINANIFGELSLIFSSLNNDEKKFQSKMAKINTAMINLKLPFEIQQLVRDEMMRTQPSLQTQEQLMVFLEYVSPSLRFQVFYHQFWKFLNKITIFYQQEEVIRAILHRIELNYFEAEQTISRQGEKSAAPLMIMGEGCNTAYMMLDSRTKICLGLIPDGTMIGLPQILFDCENFYSIEATSYCSASSLS